MKILGVIPSRYGSSRFPGKPLAMINGKSMIKRVYEQAEKASCLKHLVVATDDNRIYDHVAGFGGNVIMTDSSHSSGTERCNEVTQLLKKQKKYFDIVINIQGDEPLIDPSQIDKLGSCFTNPEVQIATLIKKIEDQIDLFNPNTVKVVFDKNLFALYFSRSAIPYLRDFDKEKWLQYHPFYKHVGIYAYKTDVLNTISNFDKGQLETPESLEQLRWLEYGCKIKLEITESENIDVNTPEDLSKIINKI